MCKTRGSNPVFPGAEAGGELIHRTGFAALISLGDTWEEVLKQQSPGCSVVCLIFESAEVMLPSLPFPTFPLHLQAPDLLKGELLVVPFVSLSMSFPFPSTSLLTTGSVSGPQRETGLAEDAAVWECEEQAFGENEEQEGQLAGVEGREGKRMESES